MLKVAPNGPAAAAGLRAAKLERGGTVVPGDVIVAIDDKPVTSARRLQSRLDDFSPGDKIKLGVLRDGKRTNVDVTLDARRDERARSSALAAGAAVTRMPSQRGNARAVRTRRRGGGC